MKLDKVILRPIITEKTAIAARDFVYTFEVSLQSSKHAVKDSVKKMFNVLPIDVKTSIVPGRLKRVSGTRKFVKSSKWKKALVTLKKGQSISLFDVSEKK